jgi:hypothetical protein
LDDAKPSDAHWLSCGTQLLACFLTRFLPSPSANSPQTCTTPTLVWRES